MAVSCLNLIHTPRKAVNRYAKKGFVFTSYTPVFSKRQLMSRLIIKRNPSPSQRLRMGGSTCKNKAQKGTLNLHLLKPKHRPRMTKTGQPHSLLCNCLYYSSKVLISTTSWAFRARQASFFTQILKQFLKISGSAKNLTSFLFSLIWCPSTESNRAGMWFPGLWAAFANIYIFNSPLASL